MPTTVQLELPTDESPDTEVPLLTNEQLINAAANAQREGRTSTLWLELLASNYHESMSYTAAWAYAEQKVADALAADLTAR